MINKSTLHLTRREFVAASGVIAGTLMVPGASMAGFAQPPPAGTRSAPADAAGVRCEFANVDGVLRPQVWRRIDGMSLELLITTADGPGFRLTNPIGNDDCFSAEDLQFGRPQELIRRQYGNEVLNQFIEEIDRRRAGI